MKPTKALTRLSLPANEPLRWLLGKILMQRAEQDNWDCIPLKFLEEGTERLEEYWNRSIAEFRASLVNPDDAPKKVENELNPAAANFLHDLDSLVAEIFCVRYLRTKKLDKFKVVLRGDETTPDYFAVLGAEEFPVEVKDLKLTASADIILQTILEERAAEKRLQLVLRDNSDKFLEKEQAEELRNWASNDLQLVPGDYEQGLSDGSIVRISIRSGNGTLIVARSDDGPSTEGEYQGLLRKAIGVVEKKILSKASIVNSTASRKIVVMRWTVPVGCALDMLTFPKRLESDLDARFKSQHPDFEFHIFTNWWNG